MFCLTTRALSPDANSEQETRRHILWWLLIRMTLFTFLVGITSYVRAKGHPVIIPPLPATTFFLLGVYAYSLAAILLLRSKAWSARRFGVVQLLSDIVFYGLFVYATGCSQSNFTALMILPVIAGGLILYRIGGLFLAAAATLLYGGILALEMFGWVPPYFWAASYKPPANLLIGANLFAVYGLIFFLAALLSGQLARRLRVIEDKLRRTSIEYDRLSILYKQIFDDITTGIITTDRGDFITSYNQAAEQITGHAREKILGQPFNRVFPAIRLQEKKGRSVCDFQKPDGARIRIGYCFSYLNMPAKDAQEEQAGRWKVITLQDISQIERMEQQVREAEKMAAIGELSASIAHDFRNPLAAISGSAQILTMDAHPLETLDAATFKTLLSIILRESNRMAKTITDFLQFARPAAIQPEWFDLNRLVDEVIARLQQNANTAAAATISKEIPDHLNCWADRQQMQTILSQLLENACNATGADQGGIVVAAHEDAANDAPVLIMEVRDQGPGIPLELREKVFAPFFSIRTDGTGLGLAIVRQIAENHQGLIEIGAATSQGCVMRLCLPLPQVPAS
jgi:two-component system sensor histidine kinase PilS (NtrC family)